MTTKAWSASDTIEAEQRKLPDNFSQLFSPNLSFRVSKATRNLLDKLRFALRLSAPDTLYPPVGMTQSFTLFGDNFYASAAKVWVLAVFADS